MYQDTTTGKVTIISEDGIASWKNLWIFYTVVTGLPHSSSVLGPPTQRRLQSPSTLIYCVVVLPFTDSDYPFVYSNSSYRICGVMVNVFVSRPDVQNRTFKIQNPIKSNLFTFSPRTLNLHPKRGHRNLDFMRSRPIANSAHRRSAYNKLGLWQTRTTLWKYYLSVVLQDKSCINAFLCVKGIFGK
jgi:hypothetical protein